MAGENQMSMTVHPGAQGVDAYSPQDILKQIALIQNVMSSAMKKGSHYGVVPGCGDKPTLLKPGAEKLLFLFRFGTRVQETVVDLPNAHREYRVTVTLFRHADGREVGCGVGSCSTMEGKYRFRTEKTGKPVPKEYWDNKNPETLGGPQFEARKNDGQWTIVRVFEHNNPADYYNCVTEDTRVLTHDLRWIPAGEVKSGDMLIGVDEDNSSEYARNLAVGEATVHGRRMDTLYKITFDDGRVVRCNGEHKWLVKKIGLKGTEWVSTKSIREELNKPKGRPRKWSVMSLCTPWVEDVSKEAGYIAGLLDADGSLGTTQVMVLFAQTDNVVLARLQSGLIDRGYSLGVQECKSMASLDKTIEKKQVYGVRVHGGFTEQLRLLGSIRPPRLIERWLTRINLSDRRLEGKGSGAGSPVGIASIENLGQGEVVLLGTSCHTYIAEGLVCHNTVLKMAKKRAQVDATLTATAASDIFTQDVEDIQANLEAYGDDVEVETVPDPPKAPINVGKPKPAPAPVPAAAPSDGSWRDVEIHFGKSKGITLGTLTDNSLRWWIDNWKPSEWPKGSNKFKQVDLDLRMALNRADADLKQSKEAAASDDIPMENTAESVPF